MRKLLPLLGIWLLAAAACAGTAAVSPTPPATPTPPRSPATSPVASPRYPFPNDGSKLILRIATGGGFVAPAYLLTEVPEFALYGDGRIIVPGPAATIFPAPLLPNLLVMRVTPAEIQKILAAADGAGLLGPDASYDAVGIADAGTTVFTTVVDGKVHRISAYALSAGGDVGGRPGGSPSVGAARAKLAQFWTQMSDPGTFLGRAVGDTEAYVPAGLRVFLSDAGPADPTQPAGQVVAWPLSTDPATTGQPTTVQGTVCVALTGNDLSSFLSVASTANTGTVWTYRNARYGVGVRPLYPNETGCAGGSL